MARLPARFAFPMGGVPIGGDKGDPKVLLKAGLALRLTECQTGHIGSCHADL
jgi:hypothetical protein